MKHKIIPVVLGSVFLFTNSFSGEMRFPVGLSYSHGFLDVYKLYKDNIEAKGYEVKDSVVYPVGLSAKAYYQFDSGFAAGCGMGPFMAILSDEANFYAFPMTAFAKFSFFQGSSVCPYVSVGGHYAPASGEYLKKNSPGFYAAIGMEFLRNKTVGFGLEFAYTSSKMEFEDYKNRKNKEINPSEFLISAYAVF